MPLILIPFFPKNSFTSLKLGHGAENILIVPDPGDDTDNHDAGVGSGGATLNALLVATEHLSARLLHTCILHIFLGTF